MAKYRIFKRASGFWFAQDRVTGKQSSLRTRDESEAVRLLNARNEAVPHPAAINLQLGRTYIVSNRQIHRCVADAGEVCGCG